MEVFDARRRVRKVVARSLCLPEKEITDDARLTEEMGLSSLDRYELAMGLEKEFGVEIDDGDMEAIRTVSDLVRYLEEIAPVPGHACPP